jgi:hypothetical protein
LAGAYRSVTGPAETVTKTLIGENAARLGLPLTVAPDLGRGATITVATRMHTLAERLMPLVDQAGIGVTVRQAGTGLVLDCTTPTVIVPVLMPEAGTVTAWTWDRSGPAATRTVVGGQGEGTAREFRSRVAAGTEATWGPRGVGEIFTDARDAAAGPVLDARGDAAIAAATPTAGLSLSLSETDRWRFGSGGFAVGDRITAQLIPGTVPVTDVLREVTIRWTADDGMITTPVVGERTDDPGQALAGAVVALARATKNINART